MAMKYETLKAIIRHQGESDCFRPKMYREEIKDLVANFRKDLNLPDLFFVTGEIAPWVSGKQAAENIRIFNSMHKKS